jgi:hypothetical protein
VLVAVALAGIFARSRIKNEADEDDEQAAASRSVTTRTPEGETVLHVKPAVQVRIGLRTQVLTRQELKPELVAYGKLEEDPSRSFVLRAPISGILHYAPGRNWPSMGEKLADGALVGMIEPRFTPAERIGFTNQLTTAESELKASTSSLAAARSAYERAKALNADDKNVSDQVLQDAAARLEAEEARFHAATQTVRQIQASLQMTDPSGSRRLVVERGGEVVELIAQPGESIEPGSPILRVAKLNELLARVQIPVGQHVPESVTTARIVAVGFEHQPVLGTRIGIAPAVDPRIQGEAFMFRLANVPFGLRPGVAVTAYVELPGASQSGVVIPQSAVVRFQGAGFTYVQTGADGFVRKPVSLDRPTKDGYLAVQNFQPGDRVVVTGAESLLSEEFKPQIVDTD